jgi:deoxyribonuclease-1
MELKQKDNTLVYGIITAIVVFLGALAFLFVLILSRTDRACGNVKIKNFRQAKRFARVIWSENQKTFYCGCSYYNKGIVNRNSCGYKPKKDTIRAKRIEWEHIVPASRLGSTINKCRNTVNRRSCLRSQSLEFNRMEADLYNLVPAIGELNAIRRNYQFGIIDGEPRDFGECNFEAQNIFVEPHSAIRGDIARVYFYMSAVYPRYVVLSEREKRMFAKWSKNDPVDAWEIERARLIEEVQGNRNEFIR